MKREYNYNDDEILELSLREIDFKIRGFNESIAPVANKEAPTRTHDISKVMKAITKDGE